MSGAADTRTADLWILPEIYGRGVRETRHRTPWRRMNAGARRLPGARSRPGALGAWAARLKNSDQAQWSLPLVWRIIGFVATRVSDLPSEVQALLGEHLPRFRFFLVDLLLRQLALRFGPLPVGLTERVRAGSDDDVARWAERVPAAASLDHVFAGG